MFSTIFDRHRFSILFLFLAFGITFFYSKNQYRQFYEEKAARHTATLGGTAEYPYNLRVLQPLAVESVRIPLSLFVKNYRTSFLASSIIIAFIFYFLSQFFLFRYLRIWFDEPVALLGVLLFVAILPVSLTGWDETGDVIMLVLFEVGFLAILSGNVRSLFVLLAVGALNREQMMLLIPFYFFAKKGNWRVPDVWKNSGFMACAFAISYGLLRFATLRQETEVQAQSAFFGADMIYNAEHLEWLVIWFASIGVFVLFGLRNIRQKPEFLRRNLALTLPIFYILVFFFRARMREIDKAFALHLILIPLALFTLFPRQTNEISDKHDAHHHP